MRSDSDRESNTDGAGGLRELGGRLRDRRSQVGLSLADVEESTKIRARYLEAIETGEISFLPGLVYAAGFVRAYAEALGLDGPAVSAEFRAAVDDQSRPKAPSFPSAGQTVPARPAAAARGDKPKAGTVGGEEPRPAPAAAPAAAAPVQHEVNVPLAVPQSSLGEPRRRASTRIARRSPVQWWAIALLVLVVAAGAYVVYLATQEAPPGPPGGGTAGPGPQPPTGDPTPPTPPLPPAFGRDRITIGTGQAGELLIEVDWTKIEVNLICGARVWLRADADGERVVDGTSEAGSIIALAAADRIEIRLGRARPTTIEVMGVDLGSAGLVDDARTVILTRRPQ